MRSVLAVVIGVLAQDVMQMPFAEDQEPVGALTADGFDLLPLESRARLLDLQVHAARPRHNRATLGRLRLAGFLGGS